MGLSISDCKVKPLQSNITKITAFPARKTKGQLKKFIGVCNYYTSQLPFYDSKIPFLISLTTYEAKFKWKENHQKIFEKLQKNFFEHPFVHLPQDDKEFLLNADGSHFAISGIMLMEFNGKLCSVWYFSKTHN